MSVGDAVFAADGAHLGRLKAIDDETLTVGGGGRIWRVPRDQADGEGEGRIFIQARSRAAANCWRVDVVAARGLRGWWERRVLGPASRLPGGRLDD